MRACHRTCPALMVGTLILALMTAVPTIATAKWIDLGSEAPLTVELLESDGVRSVVAITVGGFEAEPVTVNGKTYYDVHLAGESRAQVAGLPALPDVRRALIIPDDRAVQVNVLDAEYVDLTKMPVIPSKGNLLRTVDPATVPHTFDAFYSGQEIWPEQLVAAADPHIIRDFRGAVVDANVFQYLPADEVLRVHTRLVYEVVDAGPGRVNVLQRTRSLTSMDPQFNDIYASHFLGADAAAKRYNPVLESGGLLIIAHSAFAGVMQPLVEWKRQKGLDTRLVTLAETGPSFNQIKSYIETAYNDWAPAYVLLVGDIAQIPIGGNSDPEYSTLAGNDSYPELFVGRFSAEDPNQVGTQVQRTITYERDLVAGDRFSQRGTGIASSEGPGDDGEYDYQHQDVIRGKLIDYGYLGVDQFYQPSATSTMVTNALNDGRGFVNYTGHGSATAWSTTGFSNTHINALTNRDMLPFICSVACNNGTFTGTCFGEVWLRATDNGEPTGAIATYMSYISQSWEPPMCGQDEVTDLLVGDEMRTIGGLFFNGSCQMMDEYGADGVNEFLNWTIFGDPSLMVRTKAATDLVISHDGALFVGVPDYVVQTGEPGALCALYADDVLYGVATADAAGQAVITMTTPPLEPMDLTLTVTAYNKVTAQAVVPVLPPTGPYLVFESSVVEDTDGDADGLLDVGETIALGVELENVGVDAAIDLVAVLSSADPHVAVHGGEATYPDLPAGGKSAGDLPFQVQALGTAPDGHIAQFTLVVSGGGHTWDATFSLPVQAPQLAVSGSRVDDAFGGNGSSTADAGEMIRLEVALTNLGGADAAAVSATLGSADPFATVLTGDGGCDLIATAGEGWVGVFEVSIDATCPEPTMMVFQLDATTAAGHAVALEFEVAVGGWFDNMEIDRGWTVGAADDDATAGIWISADPVGTSYDAVTVQMEDDHSADPGTRCFVTGNADSGDSAGTNDVDGGATTLLSPVFDLSGATTATISYWRWYTNDAGLNPGEDWWEVSVTSNGNDWVTLEHTQESDPSWQPFSFELSGLVALNDQVQLRFVASDEGGGSLVEAGVDDVHLDVVYDNAAGIADDRTALPAVATLDRNYPNPFNPITRITFALPREVEIDLAVFDVSGRRVATLVSGVMEAGRHEVVWSGRNDRGGTVASGVYFSRLVADGQRRTQKMMLLK